MVSAKDNELYITKFLHQQARKAFVINYLRICNAAQEQQYGLDDNPEISFQVLLYELHIISS